MVELRPTRCAICGALGGATELFPAVLPGGSFSPEVFSARRLPDRIHFRVVQCDTCGLVRADPAADSSELARLYAASTLEYGDEIPSLELTYGRALRKLSTMNFLNGPLLEVGCGNGFMLSVAESLGYAPAHGVEPSRQAVEQAAPDIRGNIVVGVLEPGQFPADYFAVAALFQVFDHLPDPAAALDEIHRVLRPGGALLLLNHNVRALSYRVLRERSPIIDIEHTYLYSPDTARRILAQHGFQTVSVSPVFNTYSWRYIVQLLPLPAASKRFLRGVLDRPVLRDLRVRLPLGNMCVVASKV